MTPYDANTMYSAYHVRSLEIFRLRQLLCRGNDEAKRPLDICVSHDWPTGVHRYGDEQWYTIVLSSHLPISLAYRLLDRKRHFANDITKNTLGNPHTEMLLNELQPRYWFSAHLHVMFKALVQHKSSHETRFLALDKPLPKRRFLYVEEISVPKALDDGVDGLSYDAAWLAILRSTDHLWHLRNSNCYMPATALSTTSERTDFRPTEEEIECVRELLHNDLRIPENFRMTGPPHQPHETAKMFRNCSHCGIAGVSTLFQNCLFSCRLNAHTSEPNRSIVQLSQPTNYRVRQSTWRSRCKSRILRDVTERSYWDTILPAHRR